MYLILTVVCDGMGQDAFEVCTEKIGVQQLWCQTDCHGKLLTPRSITWLKNDNFAVVYNWNNFVRICDKEGNEVHTTRGGNMKLKWPSDLEYHPQRDILLVIETRTRYGHLWHLNIDDLTPQNHYSVPDMAMARYMSVLSDGDLVITGMTEEGAAKWGLYSVECLPIMDPNGKHIQIEGQHQDYFTVVVDRDDRILISAKNYSNKSVVLIFSKDSALLTTIENESIRNIRDITVDMTKNIVIAQGKCVSVFSSKGQFIKIIIRSEDDVKTLALNDDLLLLGMEKSNSLYKLQFTEPC